MFKTNKVRRLVRQTIPLVCLAALLFVASPTTPWCAEASMPNQGGNPPILFFTQRDDLHGMGSGAVSNVILRIYGMNPDGSDQMRIGDPDSLGFFARYSPDATRIAFVRSVPDPSSPAGRSQQIFVMNADGTNQVNISNDPLHHHNTPAWFPDGRIAFIQLPLDFNGGDLWIMNADGSNRQPVYASSGAAGAWYPSVSPNGTDIAFSDDSDGDDEVYVIRADGSNLRQLTSNTAHDYGVNWSPDGAKIAFSRTRFGRMNGSIAGNGDVYVIGANGSNETRLTKHGNDDFYPIWSPDGSRLVFSRGTGYADRNVDIYVMNADGSSVVQLTHTPGWNIASDWCCR